MVALGWCLYRMWLVDFGGRKHADNEPDGYQNQGKARFGNVPGNSAHNPPSRDHQNPETGCQQ